MDGLPISFWNAASYHRKPSRAKEDVSHHWRQIQGSDDWREPFDPFNPLVRGEILKYGAFAKATYDAYDYDPLSKYCGSCRYKASKLFDQVGLGGCGYEVAGYLFATIELLQKRLPLPDWLSNWLLCSLHLDSWSEDINWMGFVAVSDEQETRRIGRRDILVAWRGTCGTAEWYKDAEFEPVPLEINGGSCARVEYGFQSVYTSKNSKNKYTASSASEQVMAQIRRLVGKYHGKKNEVVSLTITGHSLGGALALLNAYEAAAAAIQGLAHVSVVSFAAPQVGDTAFVKEFDRVGVKVLRAVIKQDVVPKLPGFELGYQHGGREMHLDEGNDIDHHYAWLDLPAFHSLNTYLRLVELAREPRPGRSAHVKPTSFLVRLPSERLERALRARECWYRMVDLGLVQVPPGWGWAERDPEDIPSPPDAAAHDETPDLEKVN